MKCVRNPPEEPITRQSRDARRDVRVTFDHASQALTPNLIKLVNDVNDENRAEERRLEAKEKKLRDLNNILSIRITAQRTSILTHEVELANVMSEVKQVRARIQEAFLDLQKESETIEQLRQLQRTLRREVWFTC
ncbi:hypothetical protein EIP86_008932 [Pleurotus ostreatoroseus]|nr:hypothetical protein EIP86_008932 [Pleurotus ostreatoroseus]